MLPLYALLFVLVIPLVSSKWVTTWTSMPQLTEPHNLPPAPFTSPSEVFYNSTVRQTFHMTIGGPAIRLKISNAFGTTPLRVSAVTVALPADGAAGVNEIIPSTLQKVTFSGQESFVLPNGALAVSDPVRLKIEPESEISVSVYLAEGQSGNDNTGHPGSRTTSWMAFGNQVNAASLTGSELANVAHWYYLSAVDVWREDSGARSFAVLGDSITDGRGSETNKNNRWPDLLLTNMQERRTTANIAVLNQAAGGNRILNDGLGPSALSRVERDVLAQTNVKYAMIFEGVNDIGTAAVDSEALAAVESDLIWAYKQISTRIRTAGIPFFGATITPFCSPHGPTGYCDADGLKEKTRVKINEFIRGSVGSVFDAVVDFDKALRNSSYPQYFQDDFHDGDWLHGSVAGYQAAADAFPLRLFSQFWWGIEAYD